MNNIKLPLSTTGGKSGYIMTLIRICKPKGRENTSDKVKVRFVTCYFLLVGNAQWQKCRAVSTDALQLLVKTYVQISGIAHIPPGCTIPFRIPFYRNERKFLNHFCGL